MTTLLRGLGLPIVSNLAPTGRGVYARQEPAEWLAQFDFVALNADRTDAADTASFLIGRSVEVWFYRSPSGWLPTLDDTATIARIEALIARTGAAGGIADPERTHEALTNPAIDWHSVPRARAQAFADALSASIARGFRWGVTSYPEFPWMTTLATSGAWCSPQIYHPTGDVDWIQRWSDAFGGRIVLSVPLWGSSPVGSDLTVYSAFLRSLPLPTPGAIGWTTLSGPSDAMLRVYLSWAPARGSKLFWPPPAARPWLWTGGLLAVALAAWYYWWPGRRRRRR